MSPTHETGIRPELMARHAAWIQDMIIGKTAEHVLASGQLPEHGYLNVQEIWCWAASGVSLGRKTRPNHLVPIRITWDPAPLIITETATEQHYVAEGLGRRLEGTSSSSSPLLTAADLGDELRRLAATGAASRWQYRADLESYVTQEMKTAHSALCQELSGFHQTPIFRLIDNTALTGLVDRIMLGEAMDRLLDKALDPDAFVRVEPIRWASMQLKRAVREQLLLAVDDPRIGSEIRAFATEIGSRDPVEVSAAWTRSHPTVPGIGDATRGTRGCLGR